jgi:CHAT domain-containing protein
MLHDFEPLKETLIEGKEISRMLGVTPHVGEKALKRVITTAKSPYILHIASHGFYLPATTAEGIDDYLVVYLSEDSTAISINEERIYRESVERENPMLRSAVALAGANLFLNGRRTLPNGNEDGILTALDLSCMDLSNTELVVLSACETGLGDVETGKGIIGLRRACFVAGAQTVVSSLWPVNDEATKELMIHFYENVLSGLSRADSLRRAQLEIKNKYKASLFWASFVCYGSYRCLANWQDYPIHN